MGLGIRPCVASSWRLPHAVLLLAETPNTAGAGATGGIIGGIIAAIIATAVAATGILICRQQRKEQRLQGAEEEEE